MKTLFVQKYPYYALQHGHGLGGLFRSLSRFLVPVAKSVFKASKPLLKKGAKYAAQEGLQMGADTVKDILQGESVKDSLKKNAKKTRNRVIGQAKKKGNELLSKAINEIGRGRKRQNISTSPAKNQSRKKKKKRQTTIFDHL